MGFGLNLAFCHMLLVTKMVLPYFVINAPSRVCKDSTLFFAQLDLFFHQKGISCQEHIRLRSFVVAARCNFRGERNNYFTACLEAVR